MRHGTITCDCKQLFYFETLADSIKCIKCQKVFNTESYPEKPEETIEPIIEGEGADV